jgi:parvulin-like peptidyl-prolyl isomerase
MSSFVQVYLSPVKRGERTAADARRTLERLRRHDGPVDPATFGDATMLPTELADADEQAIGTQFGADFARAVGEMKPGEWHGPIESGFGMHLVLVTARQEGRRQSFEEVRDVLLELWQREQEEAAKNAYFTGLLDRYDVQATESVQPVLGPAIAALKGTAK